MTEARCYSIEELGGLTSLAEGDPRRRHLDACPRCRARLAAYARFLEGDEALPGADWKDADARLGAALDREIQGKARAGGEPAAPRAAASPGDGARGPWWRSLAAGWRLRPAAAIAVLAALVAGAYFLRDSTRREAGDFVPRSDRGSGSAGRAGVVTLAPRVASDGTVMLSWHPVQGADAYRIRVLGADLTEITRLPSSPETTRVVGRADAPTRPTDRGATFWVVDALRSQDVIASSPPEPLPTP